MLSDKLILLLVVISVSCPSTRRTKSHQVLEFETGEKLLDPKHDFVFKKVFSDKDILLAFINSALNQNFNEIISIDTEAECPSVTEKEKIIFFDIVCKNDAMTAVIEVQYKSEPFFLQRWLFYICRRISSSLNAKGVYRDSKPMYFIGICDFTLFPHKTEYISTHKILDVKTHSNDVPYLSLVFIELAKLDNLNPNASALESVVEKLSYFLWFNTQQEDYEAGLKFLMNNNDLVRKAVDAATMTLWSPVEKEIYEQYDNIVCKHEDQIEAALNEGKNEGKAEEKAEIIQRMLNSNVDFNIIKTATGLEKNEIKELFKNLGKPIPNSLNT